jgi:sugar phosphate isomerase/epimerase
MNLGYNTNGLAHHDLVDAIHLLADTGYTAIALTLDHHALNPFDPRLDEQLATIGVALQERNLTAVVETGARYLLNPRRKHEPTFVTTDPAGRAKRLDFLKRAVDIADQLGAVCVSFWSGVVHDGAGRDAAFERLVPGLTELVHYAAGKNVVLGFEPEPGMLVDTMASFAELLERLDAAGGAADQLQLTLDIGHLHCLGEVPIAERICQWKDRLVNLHIEDMRRGKHEHLMFGEGEIDFPPVIAALTEIGYRGPVNVELSRHSHDGPAAAQQAYRFLHPLMDKRRM